MKQKERWAAEWMRNRSSQQFPKGLPIEICQDPRLYGGDREFHAFLAGFEKAREEAATWLVDHAQHDMLYIPKFAGDQLKQLGEEDAE